MSQPIQNILWRSGTFWTLSRPVTANFSNNIFSLHFEIKYSAPMLAYKLLCTKTQLFVYLILIVLQILFCTLLSKSKFVQFTLGVDDSRKGL